MVYLKSLDFTTQESPSSTRWGGSIYSKDNKVNADKITLSSGKKLKSSDVYDTFLNKTMTKANIKISLDKITQTQYSDNVTIKGRLTTDDGNEIIWTRVNLKINNEKPLEISTDSEGYFEYTYNANKLGLNKVKVSPFTYYDINRSKSTTFNVTKKNTIITLNNIQETQYLMIQ